MESIEQMIKRLCPGGVEWKKISEIGTVMRGTSFQKKHFTDEGTPCIHYGQIYTQYAHHVYETLSFVGEEISRSPRRAKTGALIMATTSENIEDVGKCIVWLGEKDIIVSNDACFIQHSLNPKYLGYLLQTGYFNAYKKKVATGTKVIRINADAVADFVIPVPPLEIQNRIVEVLDKMTTLEAELEAELETRKRQYEYYRSKLLTFSEVGGIRKVVWKKIGEIGTVMRGTSFQKKHFTDEGTPCIHYGQIYTRYGTFANKTFTYVNEELAKGKRLAKKGDLIMAVTSENLEDVGKCLAWLGEDDILVSNHACFIRHSLNPKYLAYFLQTSYFFNYKKKISKGVKVIDLDLNMFGDMLIPVPSMEEQARIVSILDRFEALTTDLQSGLPAEIEARRQQYEYYRNKLLTFEVV